MPVKRIAFGMVVLLQISILTPLSANSVKPGTPCSKIGVTKTYNGEKFTCVKKGKKKYWSKGVAVSQVMPTPTPAPTPIQTPSPAATPTPTTTPTPEKLSISDQIEICKIPDRSSFDPGVNDAYVFGGFTSRKPPVSAIGTHTWYLIPVDFADLRGEANWRSEIEKQIKFTNEFYSTISYGKLKIEWKIYDNWITLPGNSKDYAIPFSGEYVTTEIFWQKAIAEVDKYIDFTGVTTVNFILPKSQSIVKEGAQGFPWTGEIRKYYSQESKFNSFTLPGGYFNNEWTSYWTYWVHEYGHVIGIPHLGGSRWAYSFQPYDLMGSQDIARDISGWSRFAVTKWMEDEWVYCKEKSAISSELIYLSPINDGSNATKLAVIPLNKDLTLILESRRVNSFASMKPKMEAIQYLQGAYPLFAANPIRDGVFAYIYDSRLGHIEEYLSLIPGNRNPVLIAGESISFEGVTVKVLEVGSRDKVLITKSD
jgi:M6 family metalloprotease-like protein